MILELNYFHNGINYHFGVLNHSDYSFIELPGVFVLHVYKVHNHSYYFKGFLYKSKTIYCSIRYKSKEKLFCAIQNFLQQ